MEMIGMLIGAVMFICLFVFIVCGGIISIIYKKKVRLFTIGCLLPCVLVFLFVVASICKSYFLDEPLMTAINEGDTNQVRKLLSRGADPNVDFDEDTSALSMAAEEGHTDIVSLLLDRGADINTQESRPPLCRAVEERHADVVRVLLQHGAKVKCRNSGTGQTPLQTAKINGDTEIKRLLLDAGATY